MKTTDLHTPSQEECRAIFVSSCIEAAAAAAGMEAQDMYLRMQRIGLIEDYILPSYEVLHAESRNNVTEDILNTIEIWERKKGVVQ